MGFREALTSLVRAVSRPCLIAPAAFAAGAALLSPPAIDDASAQGFRMQGSRGGGFYATGPSGRLPPMSGGISKKGGVVSKSGRPGGSASTGPYPKGGKSTGGMGGRYPGETTDNRRPKGDHRYPPRWPRRPIYVPPAVVAVPYGPPNIGSGPPPSPPTQSARRPGSGVPASNERRYVPNEVVVEVAGNVSPQTITALTRRHRLTQLETINLQSTGTSMRRLRINDRRSVPAVVRALEREGAVMAVQPNYIATLQQTAAAAAPTDLDQYALARMRMPEAHALATGNQVLIAVIDAGVDTRHPELAGLILDTFDAIGTGDPTHAHGTSIVGAIAARARLRGTAPGAHILVARAFGTHRSSMDGKTTDIIKAIEWVMQRNARILNMSFAGARDPAIERHLHLARERGIILVASVGNAGPTSAPLYPAANPAVIAVTATDDQDRIFRAANRGNHIAIAAPGVNLMLPTVGGEYRMTSGTSFSSAEITGVIALMLERNPGLNHEAVRRALMSTARDLGTPGLDPQFGAGLVDAYQAIMSIVPAAPSVNAVPAEEARADAGQ